VVKNQKLVTWFLSHRADPNGTAGCNSGITPMVYAAREASLSVIKLLVEYGGKVKSSDLIAQAALGDSWGSFDRLEVIHYLLQKGALINALAASTWYPESKWREYNEITTLEAHMKKNQGGQTALHIAQISGHQAMVAFLMQNGADSSVKPLKTTRIIEDRTSNMLDYPE